MDHELIDAILRIAVRKNFPDDTAYMGLSVEHVTLLAERFGISGLNIEITALEKGIIPERYARNMKTFSAQDQITLLRSEVTVVGLGGLGGTVAEILARIGVGTLNLIDGETFEDSNLNRQFLSTRSVLSKPKTEAAGIRIHEINPVICTREHPVFLDEKNAASLIGNSDVAVDCLDNLKSRFILENAARRIGIPMVSAAVAGNCGQVTTIFPDDPGLRLIYGDPGALISKGAERILGCLPQAVTLLAALESSEAVKVLLGRGSLFRNRMLAADLMENTIEQFILKKDAS